MLLENIKTERDKYLWIYNESGTKSYGKRNHGSFAYPIVEELKPQSILDVGCGKGHFVEWANRHGIMAIGMDFASGYGLMANLLDIPFPDNFFDMVTAFDVLEHVKKEDLYKALNEMNRVAIKYWLLSIGYGPSKIKTPWGKMQLHPIATKQKEWWTPILSQYGTLSYRGQTRQGNPYILAILNK